MNRREEHAFSILPGNIESREGEGQAGGRPSCEPGVPSGHAVIGPP